MNDNTATSAILEIKQLLATPTAIHSQNQNSITIAHNALENLRNTGDTNFLFLRTILELIQLQQRNNNNSNILEEELLFHCITGCRYVLLLKRWNTANTNTIQFYKCVRDYFMFLGNILGPYSKVCQLACYVTCVSFWKCIWADGESKSNHDETTHSTSSTTINDEQRRQFIQIMEQQVSFATTASTISPTAITLPLFQSKNDFFRYFETMIQQPQPIIPKFYYYLLIDCMVNEFDVAGTSTKAVSSSSTSYNNNYYKLPIEFHKQVHLLFEKQNLLQCLLLSINGLDEICKSLSTTTMNVDTTNYIHIVIKLISNILSWEFGSGSNDNSSTTSTTTSIRLPIEWRVSHITQPDFCNAIFTIHDTIMNASNIEIQQQQQSQSQKSLTHDIRQLIVLLSSMNSSIFESTEQRKNYMIILCEGTYKMLQQSFESFVHSSLSSHNDTDNSDVESVYLFDCIQLVTNIISNFRLSLLIEISTIIFIPLLQLITNIGCQLIQDQMNECQQRHHLMQQQNQSSLYDYNDDSSYFEYRDNALSLLLNCIVLLCDDPWLLYTCTDSAIRHQVQVSLSDILNPLYEKFITCRIKIISFQEQAIHSKSSTNNHDDDVYDEIHEYITEVDLIEEIESISIIGRLNLNTSIVSLSNLFAMIMPQLQTIWENDDTNADANSITPYVAGLLEEARLLTMYVSYLLTDSNDGESPTIPDTILMACQYDQTSNSNTLVANISSAIEALLRLANLQVQKISANQSNPRLSPLLASTFLTFLHRWVPAYIIYPTEYCSSSKSYAGNPLVLEWANTTSNNRNEKAMQVITFCTSMCFNYQCHWPLETSVQEWTSKLLLSIARCNSNQTIRSFIVSSPAFIQMVQFHCILSGIRHSVQQNEFVSIVQSKIGTNTAELNQSMMNMMVGYHRLPYTDKANVVTAILVACSSDSSTKSSSTDANCESAGRMMNDTLQAIHVSFTSFIDALSTKQIKYDNIHAKEMACLCVELFGGVIRASEMSNAGMIPQFITLYLPNISGLMSYYSTDLTVCEIILRFFRDYTERFIVLLDREQSLALFNAVADVLKAYSTNHCTARIIKPRSKIEAETEEDQSYGDILCAVQLLINLGTKDFIDCCGDVTTTAGGVQTNQVTDMIFFGLQQILPLMTQGLLQYPTLCKQFFELVGFMMDTYPDKICALPYNLFEPLTESLLFGMSHQNSDVGRASLQGLASIAREHISSNALNVHISQHNTSLIDNWNRRLLTEVIFQNVVTDRIEATGMALLPMVAINVHRFVVIVQEIITNQMPNDQQQQRERLNAAFTKLIQPDIISKVAATGYEGRANRVRFKKSFEEFVNEIHSFLVLR